jgi:hypothetical protein
MNAFASSDVVYDRDDTFDIFYNDEYVVGDEVRVAIGFDWRDLEPEYDTSIARITSLEQGTSIARVSLHFVSSNLSFDVFLEHGRPFNIMTSDFLRHHVLTPPKVETKRRRSASIADKLAKHEAFYDYEIAALALSENFLKTRNRAYKRALSD